jgi:hypothetical protein
MLNISLGWAFLLSILALPFSKLLPTEGLKHLPAYQNILTNICIDYWLPTVLIYLFLRTIRAQRYLKPNVALHIIFGISNVLLIFYVGARAFASMIPGGGATFALNSLGLGALVVVPCKLALLIGTLWLLIRSISRSRSDTQYPWINGSPILKTASGILAISMLLPPAGYIGWIYISNLDQIKVAVSARDEKKYRFEKLCQEVKIDIRKKVSNASSVYFSNSLEDYRVKYDLLKHLDYVDVKKGSNPVIIRYTKKDGEEIRQVKFNYEGVSEEKVSESTAQYEINYTWPWNEADHNIGLNIVKIQITDRSSGEVLAQFSKVNKNKGVRFVEMCPRNFDNSKYQQDIIGYVLGLYDQKKSRDISDKIAAVNMNM